MTECHLCGNDLHSDVLVCPYCGAKQEKQPSRVGSEYRHKNINLEIGRPFVNAAINKLRKNIEVSHDEGIRVLTVIHGYGSSGKGGRIRVESRKLLSFLVEKGEIQSFITGEEFNRKAGSVKMLLRRFPQLNKHAHLNRRNPGITIVVL